MSIIAGCDEKDMNTLPDFFEIQPTIDKKLKVGLIKDCMTSDVEPDVLACVNSYADKMRLSGHIVEEVDLPMMKYVLAIYYIIVPAEISSNLARYDGIRYTYQSKTADSLSELYGKSRDEGFMTENKRRIMIGSFVLSSGFYDAYYLQAQKARTLLIEEYNKLFETYDILLCPVAPTTAFSLGKNISDPVKMYLEDIMTAPASLAGLPALSVPAGLDSNRMPIGVQLIGPAKSDAKLLALARVMEKE